MPRRREVPKRDILPDPKFANVEVSKFVNTIMKSGKKSVAERIVYGAFDQIVTKTGKDPLEVFGLALGNIKPLVEVKSRRVGGANYPPERGWKTKAVILDDTTLRIIAWKTLLIDNQNTARNDWHIYLYIGSAAATALVAVVLGLALIH